MDRLNIFYDSIRNIYLCQDGCEFILYNETSKRSKCNCNIQREPTITNIKDIIFDKKQLVNNFLLSSLKNSNFKVMKCYKLIFSLNGQISNIGSYILLSIIFILIILMICYYIKGNKQLYEFIQIVINQRFLNKNKNQRNKTEILKERIKDNKISKKKVFNFSDKNLKIKTKKKKDSKSKKKKKNKDTLENINKIKIMKKTNFPPKKGNILFLSPSSDIKNSKNDSLNVLLKKDIISKSIIKKNRKFLLNKKKINFNDKNNKMKSKNKIGKKKNINIINYVNNINIFNNAKKERLLMETKNDLLKNLVLGLNDEEMNSLSYQQALILDKRTYFQYYCSLLRKKHIILFTFYPNNDYNLYFIKISLFLISFSLYMTINGFFFTDNTMHKIMIDNGKYNFIFQIPQILYSTTISAISIMILKRLSLSELHILSLKYEKNIKIAHFKSKQILTCLKIKFIIFFILSFLFMFFFWYFISGFCAVYKNTQLTLIENTLISFLISMIYPFGLNLFPGFFRIPSLRAKNKNKKCLYKISGLIALI